jgi:hypothetical protein
MKCLNLILALMFFFASLVHAQDVPSQPMAGPGAHDQMQGERHQKMMEMHKQQMEAMQADVEKMKSSVAQMKADVAKMKNSDEKTRWQNNVDMWEIVIGHIDQMLKQMNSMGHHGMHGMGNGMMHDHNMGGPPTTPDIDKKPE